jgi:FK506-binding protein 1
MILGNSLQDVLSAGDKETFPKQGDELSMHYVGTLASNGQVIQGWDEGVMQMSLGEKAVLHISSDFGYGSRGAGKFG